MELKVFRRLKIGAFFIWKCMTNEGKFDVNERKDVLGKWKKLGFVF